MPNRISKAELQDMFANMRAKTSWNLDGDMLWGYFFTDGSRSALERAARHLEGEGYRFVDLFEPEDEGKPLGYFFLHVERVEKHNVDSLYQRNTELEAFAAQHGLDTFDGMDVGPAPIAQSSSVPPGERPVGPQSGHSLSSEGQWTIATGEEDGKPVIFRIRNNSPAFASKATFPHLLAVSWEYQSPNDQGMPSPEDAQRMSTLEDLLEAGLEGVRQAFLTVIVTGNGVREWQWYARDPERVMEEVNKILGPLEPFPVEFNFQDDPEWEGYSRFVDITGSDA